LLARSLLYLAQKPVRTGEGISDLFPLCSDRCRAISVKTICPKPVEHTWNRLPGHVQLARCLLGVIRGPKQGPCQQGSAMQVSGALAEYDGSMSRGPSGAIRLTPLLYPPHLTISFRGVVSDGVGYIASLGHPRSPYPPFVTAEPSRPHIVLESTGSLPPRLRAPSLAGIRVARDGPLVPLDPSIPPHDGAVSSLSSRAGI